jgi:hypothetical protein
MGAAYAKVGAGDVSGGVLGMLEVARAHADASDFPGAVAHFRLARRLAVEGQSVARGR